MSTGLRIRNQDTQLLQIASGYRNLELVKSGTLNVNNFTGGGDIRYNQAYSGTLASTQLSNSMHVIRYIEDNVTANSAFSIVQTQNETKLYISQAAPNKIAEYYTFGYSSNQPTGPVGLKLRSEDGSTYYDSRKKSLRVLGTIQLTAIPDGGPALIGQYFPGTKIGLAFPNPRFYYDSPYPEIGNMYADGLNMTSDNRVFISQKNIWYQNQVGRFQVGNTVAANQNATVFIIDLTEVPLNFTA